MSPSSHPLSVVLAGGGTAGHIEPALAVAEALRRSRQDVRVTALGTTRGLETTLVPARGVDLELIPAVPVPRKVNKDLVTLPFRLVGALQRTRRTLKALQADVVVGFGGYVSAPAYLAAKSLGLPIVVHEANARAGVANKLGVRLGGRALAATPDSGLGPGADTEVVGIPVRDSLLSLDRGALRGEAREFFGLDPEAPVLLVTGGSQGAASINTAVSGAAGTFADAGVGVLHAYGRKNAAPADGGPGYVAVPYIDRMDLALAAADMVLCRSGAMTVAEISACGLPAVYVPLPHGNGEQELNARPVVDAGGGVIVPDAELNAGRVAREVVPLLRDKVRLRQAGEAAAAAGHRDAAERIAQIVIEAGSPAGERK